MVVILHLRVAAGLHLDAFVIIHAARRFSALRTNDTTRYEGARNKKESTILIRTGQFIIRNKRSLGYLVLPYQSCVRFFTLRRS